MENKNKSSSSMVLLLRNNPCYDSLVIILSYYSVHTTPIYKDICTLIWSIGRDICTYKILIIKNYSVVTANFPSELYYEISKRIIKDG